MGGHKQLVEYIEKNNLVLSGKILIEIGGPRELTNNTSTEYFIDFCKKNQLNFICIDMDPIAIANCKKMFLDKQFTNGQAICMKGEDFLYDYKSNIDFIYLDAFDFSHKHHTESRNKVYKEQLGCAITNELCHKMHLKCCENLINKLTKDSVIGFDDIHSPDINSKYGVKSWDGNLNNLSGKGVLAIPFLIKNNVILKEYREPSAIFQINDTFIKKNLILEKLNELSLDDLKNYNMPWLNIKNQLQNIDNTVSISDILYCYQNNMQEKFFYKNYKKNEDLGKYLQDKRVAVVGPAPYLEQLNNGNNIDSYDVIIRINEVRHNTNYYGEKYGDIIISNLNDLYRDKLLTYLKTIENEKKPKFIICSDSRVSESQCVHHIINKFEQDTGIKVINLIDNNNEYSDRRHLYWEICPQRHKENSILNTDNFNSPYGCINMILGYDIKELYITGVDFYGVGLNNTSNKYSDDYLKYYPKDGANPYGPSTALHDQLSQVIHFKNVILKNNNHVTIDDYLKNLLFSEKTENRCNKYMLLEKKQFRKLD